MPDLFTQPLTHLDLQVMKRRGEKITCLTAYDASFSALLDTAGVDVILVGDSLGMVIQGHRTTLPVSMDDMVYHSRCVTQTCQRALVIADLPFMSSYSQAIVAENAARLIQEGRVQMVKLEGAKIELVRFLTEQGISVCGHLGLLPQFVHQMGGYKRQATTPPAAQTLLNQALDLQSAGANLLVLECVPATLGKTVSEQLEIPVIGIGAGVDCDGQVLVTYDLLGIGSQKPPRFAKNFLHHATSIEQAISDYCHAVKQKHFPSVEHSF